MRKIFLLLGILCIGFTKICFATEGVVITEIMYNPAGNDNDHEWIELKNTTSSSVDITGWRINDGTNHVFNDPNGATSNGGQGVLSIPAGGFVIIAENAATFMSEHAGYTGSVIDASFALTNETDIVKICSAACGADTVINEVTYTASIGGSDDGNSLQLYNGGWIANAPTPGADAIAVTSGGGGGGSSSGSSGSGSSSATTPSKPVFLDTKKDPVWSASINPSVPSLFTNTPFTLTPKVVNPKNTTMAVGRFVYTLGDGRVFERKNSQPVEIQYSDSGAYMVYFDYYENSRSSVPVISEHLLISIEDAPILIDVDTINGYKISLSNLHPKEVNISSWVLSDTKSTFTFPKNTFLPAKQTMTLNNTVHTLSGFTLRLITPTGHEIAQFPSQVKVVNKKELTQTQNVLSTPKTVASEAVTQEIISSTAMPTSLSVFESAVPITEKTYVSKTDTIREPVQNLGANALHASTVFSNQWMILFVILLIVTCIVLFFFLKTEDTLENKSIETINQSSTNAQVAQAYTIIEEK
jgi:hypothetical protein